MVQAGQRAVLDGETERPLRLEPEGMGQRGADRAAMSDDDDVALGVAPAEALDGRTYPCHDDREALAPRRRLACRRVPEAMHAAVAPALQLVIAQALPVAEVLLDEGRLLGPLRGHRCAGGENRLGRLA